MLNSDLPSVNREYSDNKWGFRGVEYHGRRGKFRSAVRILKKRYYGPYRETAIESARDYDRMLVDHYSGQGKMFLNFPLNGEAQAIVKRRSPVGCVRGHPPEKWNEDNRICRICNRLAVARLHNRKGRPTRYSRARGVGLMVICEELGIKPTKDDYLGAARRG
jgi:hypothetical protein